MQGAHYTIAPAIYIQRGFGTDNKLVPDRSGD